MINMEDWVTIRNLKKHNPQMGNRTIAKQLGLSRNTVKAALQSEEPNSYSRKEAINPELVPFKEVIESSLVLKKLKPSRILEDIRSKGCKVSRSAFYRYIEHLKPTSQKAFMRYETKPGEQGQFDWSEYSILLNGLLTKIYVFCFILGFSRFRVYWPSLSQTQSSVFEAIEHSLWQIGGAPEKVQTDNHSTLVVNASKDDFQWNPRYLKLAEHYGFHPSRSLPGHPWSKGKVENPFSYLENHFIAGNEFQSFEELSSRLKEFQVQVNGRIHETTQAEPDRLFQEMEKDVLFHVPDEFFVGHMEEFRKVSSDCLISYGGNRYSVPHIFAGKEVWIRVSQGLHLRIYSQKKKLIATYLLERNAKKKIFLTDAHFQGYRGTRGTWERLSEEFLRICPGNEDFLMKLKAQKRISPARHLTKIVEAIRHFRIEDITEVIQTCHRYNEYHSDLFVELLHRNCSPSPSVDVKDSMHQYIPAPQGIVRTLDCYRVMAIKSEEGV